MNVPKPTNLYEIAMASTGLYQISLDDRRMAIQVKEGSNALGKAISAAKTHLDACRISKVQPEGEWNRFLLESPPHPTP